MHLPERWHLPLVLAFVAALSLPKFRNEFVWDDLYVIQQGTVIHDWNNLPGLFTDRAMAVSAAGDGLPRGATDTYRPVTLATFFWDAALSGRTPWSYHLTNLLLHLLAVALVHRLSRRLVGEGELFASSFAALSFGVAPHLAEAHVWINGRSDVMATACFLGALLVAWNTERTWTPARWGFAATLALAAYLSKETAGFAALLVPFVPVPEGATWRTRVARTTPFVAGGVVYLLLRGFALGGSGVAMPESRLAITLANYPLLVFDGMQAMLAPHSVFVRALVDDYAETSDVVRVMAAAGLLGMVGVLAYAGRRASAFGFAFFAATLFPAAILTTTLWPGFGRFLYLPSAGLALAVADGLAAVSRRDLRLSIRRAGQVVLAAHFVFVCAMFVRTIDDWRDEESLYGAVIREAPHRAHGWGWLGFTWLERGDAVRAAAMFDRSIACARTDARYYLGFATALVRMQRYADAHAKLVAGYERFPSSTKILVELAALETNDDPGMAAMRLVRCLDDVASQQACVDGMRRLLASDTTGRLGPALIEVISSEAAPDVRERLLPMFRQRR